MARKAPTVREIARQAGVSASTVSRALHSDFPVSKKSREKIEDALQYLSQRTPEARARAFNFSVGIILPAVSALNLCDHPSVFEIISSLVETLTEKGVSNTTIVYDDDASDLQLHAPKDGYLIIGTSEQQEKEILKLLRPLNVPCMLINRHSNERFSSSVVFDDEVAAYTAVQHLIELGHKKIAFVGGNQSYQNTIRRLRGYRNALEAAAIPIREDYIHFGEYSEISGYQIGRELLALKPWPTAAFFASDTLAAGCMQYLKEHGVHLPQDMAIVGFGNTNASRMTVPPLTTINQSDKDVGFVAASALVQMLELPIIRSQKITIKTPLIIRESSGVPKG